MDPFARLPVETREMIISYLMERDAVMKLCQASPVFMNQLKTSNLLKYWNTLHEELGCRVYPVFQDALALLSWSRDDTRQRWPTKYHWPPFELYPTFSDPLFTSQHNLIFELYGVYQRMCDRFSQGPTLVPTYLEKYSNHVDFTRCVTRAFGEQGQDFPIVLPPINSKRRNKVFCFLIAIDAMDNQCPSAFKNKGNKRNKRLTKKEDRSRRLVDLMSFRISPEVSEARTEEMLEAQTEEMLDAHTEEIFEAQTQQMLERIARELGF